MHEHPQWTTGKVLRVDRLWILWVVLIPVIDLAGPAPVPRQLKQDSAVMAGKQQIQGREFERRERGKVR